MNLTNIYGTFYPVEQNTRSSHQYVEHSLGHIIKELKKKKKKQVSINLKTFKSYQVLFLATEEN